MGEIKVGYGKDIKTESVIINPSISAVDNEKTGARSKNILAKAGSTAAALREVYGRKF